METEFLNDAVVSLTRDFSSEQAVVTVTFGERVELVPSLYMTALKIVVVGENGDVL